jgi:hypothetical protein
MALFFYTRARRCRKRRARAFDENKQKKFVEGVFFNPFALPRPELDGGNSSENAFPVRSSCSVLSLSKGKD